MIGRFVSSVGLASAVLAFCPSAGSSMLVREEPLVLAQLPDEYELEGEGVDFVTWAPDGSRVAWVARKGGESFPMWTEAAEVRSGETYTYINRPAFSDDGAHVAFRVGNTLSKSKERWSVLLDGKPEGKEDWIGSVRFWPGTDDLVYWTQPGARLGKEGFYEGGSYLLRVGKKKGKKWSDAGVSAPMAFAADGSRGAQLVSKGSGWSVLLVDPKKQTADRNLHVFAKGLELAADGETWALAEMRSGAGGGFGARSGEGGPREFAWTVRRGEEKIGEQFRSADSPVFGPTEARLAFRARGEKGYGVVIEGSEAAELTFGFVTEIVWEPPGGKIPAGSEGLAFVVIDGGEERRAPGGFSAGEPEGGEARVICLDGAGAQLPGGRPFLEIRDLVVAPGGASERNLAYRARDDKGWHLVHEWFVGDTPNVHISKVFDALGPPVFIDGKFAAGALLGRELLWVTVP